MEDIKLRNNKKVLTRLRDAYIIVNGATVPCCMLDITKNMYPIAIHDGYIDKNMSWMNKAYMSLASFLSSHIRPFAPLLDQDPREEMILLERAGSRNESLGQRADFGLQQ